MAGKKTSEMLAAIKIVEQQLGVAQDLGLRKPERELLAWKQVYEMALEAKGHAETMESMASDARMSATRALDEIRARIGLLKEELGILDEEDGGAA